jgi:hypothetical protein
MTAPPSWVAVGTLGPDEPAIAPYQRLAGGEPPDAATLARLSEGGDALWGVALRAGLLAQRLPSTLALRAPPAAIAPAPGRGLPDHAVAIGLVDGPVAFAHRRLRRASGASRLDWLWLLDGAAAPGGGDAPFGCELHGAALAELLARHAVPGGVDEESLYRAVGHLDMARAFTRDVARAATHGAAVLGLAACGPRPRADDPDDPGAFGREIIDAAVDAGPEAFPLMVAALPARVLGDTSGAFNALHVVLALDRMLRRAASLGLGRARPLPVVVSISLGLNGGPGDGSGLLERYIDAVSAADIPGLGERRFVLPVGNERQSRLAGSIEAPMAADGRPLWWRLPPDDGTPSFLEVWTRPLASRPEACALALSLAPPGEAGPAPLERAEFGRIYALAVANGTVARAFVQWIAQDPARPGGPGRGRILVAVPPTRPDSGAPGDAPAPPGDWRLVATGTGADRSCFPCDLYVQRDDSLDVDRPRGRQSRLVDPAWLPFDETGRRPMGDDPQARVRRTGTINAYATASAALLAGGRWGRGGAEVHYSSQGDGRPVLFAVTDDSPARPGVRVVGTRSGGFARYAGASMAAPAVARDLALRISAGLRAGAR